MMKRTNRLKIVTLTCLACAPVLSLAGAAHAQSDRDLTTPTGWIWLYGTNSATLNTWIGNGFRPFDIDRAGGTGLDTIMVHNSGAYEKTDWNWYDGLTPAALSSALSSSGRRLIDLEPYDAGAGVLVFKAVAISNSGDDAAGWGWLYNQTQASLVNWIANSQTPLRIIDLDRYTLNGTTYYSGVAISNAGVHARPWWWYFNVTPAQISQLAAQNNARLVNIEPHTGGISPTFDVVMVHNDTGQSWWWDFSLTGAAITDLLDLNGARLIDLERYTDWAGDTRFACIMTDNSVPLSQQVRSIAASNLSAGAEGGGYMKQVGGGVLASVGADHVFEPASMLKVLYGAYAIDQCAAGADMLTNDVFVGDTCNNDECPDGVNCNPGWEDLSVAIAEMLVQSDNNRTKVIHDRYGRATLNSYAAALGMTRTQINHDIGCGQPPNELTLRDAGLLYERIADGALFSDNWQNTLYGLMINRTGSQGSLADVITDEASAFGLTSQELSAFRSQTFAVWKSGSYSGSGINHRATGSWMRLPFKDANGNVLLEEFVIQSFVNDEPNATVASDTNSAMWWAMARDRIRAALATWDAACTSPIINNQPDSISVAPGGVAQFNVIVSGNGSTTFRWRRNGVNLSDGAGPGGSTISGATTATLTISGANDLNEGTYSVVISRDCGSATSQGATLTVAPPCRPDFDGSGELNSQDFFDFLAAFFAGSGAADFNTDRQVNSQDFFDFLAAFFAGC